MAVLIFKIIIICQIQSQSAKGKTMFFQNKVFNNQISITPVPHESETLTTGVNYSAKHHSRVLKNSDSTVTWSTGLLRVPLGHNIEVNYHLLTNGMFSHLHEISASFIHYKTRNEIVYIAKDCN